MWLGQKQNKKQFHLSIWIFKTSKKVKSRADKSISMKYVFCFKNTPYIRGGSAFVIGLQILKVPQNDLLKWLNI